MRVFWSVIDGLLLPAALVGLYFAHPSIRSDVRPGPSEPVTLERVSAMLSEEGIRHRVHPDGDCLIAGFRTRNYRDRDGDDGILVVVALEEDGELLKVFAPQCYSCAAGPHKDQVLAACMMISWRTKMVQFGYDPSDGEIRCSVDLPLEDATLTRRQLVRCVRGLVGLIDFYDPVVRHAMGTGEVRFPEEEQVRELLELLRRGLAPERRHEGGPDAASRLVRI